VKKMDRPKKHLTKDDVIALAKEYGYVSYDEKGKDDFTLLELAKELKCSKRQAREITKKLLKDGKVREVRVRLSSHAFAKVYRPV